MKAQGEDAGKSCISNRLQKLELALSTRETNSVLLTEGTEKPAKLCASYM